MSANPQTQAISIINRLIAAGQSLAAAKAEIDAISSSYTQLTLGTVIAALATAPLNADGSLGAADTNPNVAHPIDYRVFAVLATPPSRAISANDIGSLLTGAQGVSLYLSGASSSAQGQLPQLFAKITGG